MGNAISLRLSTEASIQLMKETMPQSYKLFYLLGCLPDGIKNEHLSTLWPHVKDIEDGVKSFKDLNFLRNSKDKIQLKNYLIDHVSETLEFESKKEIFKKICVFHSEFLKTLYEVNGAIERDIEINSSNQIVKEIIIDCNTTKLQKKESVFSQQLSKYFSQNSVAVSSTRDKKEQIFEVMADIGNIEFCLDFFTSIAEGNTNKKQSGIKIFQTESS